MKSTLAVLITLIVPVLGLGQGLNSAPAAAPAPIVLPAGSILEIRLGTTLTSKSNRTGDHFTGTVSQAVVDKNRLLVPEGSVIDGHVAFMKAPGRVKGRAEMRVVLDKIKTPDDYQYNLAAALDQGKGNGCNSAKDDEGTLQGCAKDKGEAARDVAQMAAVGAGIGASVGMGHQIDCSYYGQCGGPGWGEDIAYGAAIGASAALVFNLLQRHKDLILVQGSSLTFVVNHSVQAAKLESSAPQAANNTP
jgi:hypothetical protein